MSLGSSTARLGKAILAATLAVLSPVRASAQFLDDFGAAALRTDPDGLQGWSFFTGDGEARMDFRQAGHGHAQIAVDATHDKRGIWWALIKRKVSDHMDLGLLGAGGHELRVEARIRVSHAPRRVNLHLNTQKTTDFHSHLMEFDIPDTQSWHTISMTTKAFPAAPGDTVFGQFALMDWGLEKYRVELDYFKVDIVDPALVGPDQGEPIPYHPPIPDLGTFRQEMRVVQDAMIDLENPDVNLNNWYVRDGTGRRSLLTVGGTQYVILRWDLSAFAGRRVSDQGVLELTTHSVQRSSDDLKDFGIVRVVEILAGDPAWDQKTVTTQSLCRGQPLERVLNNQMIIDYPVTEGDGGKTRLVISRRVLQRMLDGKTLGIAIKPLGAITASFDSMENDAGRTSARLFFNLGDP
jgi:hypothetical protein